MKGFITAAFVVMLCMKGLADDCIGIGTDMLPVAFEDAPLFPHGEGLSGIICA